MVVKDSYHLLGNVVYVIFGPVPTVLELKVMIKMQNILVIQMMLHLLNLSKKIQNRVLHVELVYLKLVVVIKCGALLVILHSRGELE